MCFHQPLLAEVALYIEPRLLSHLLPFPVQMQSVVDIFLFITTRTNGNVSCGRQQWHQELLVGAESMMQYIGTRRHREQVALSKQQIKSQDRLFCSSLHRFLFVCCCRYLTDVFAPIILKLGHAFPNQLFI